MNQGDDYYNPNDYAEKKRLALTKSKVLRDRGYDDDEAEAEYSFKPVITKRPQYLDKHTPNSVALLKRRLESDDIMERPLPAAIKHLNLDKSQHKKVNF